MKVGCLIVYLVGGLKQRKTAFKRIFMEGYLYCDARRARREYLFLLLNEEEKNDFPACVMSLIVLSVDIFD